MPAKKVAKVLGPEVSNGAKVAIESGIPFTLRARVRGVSPGLIMHAWNCEAIANLPGKGAKKKDDLETYVRRDDEGYLCIPGEYFRGSMINAGRSRKDPRSSRKSMMDLLKAAVIPLTYLAPISPKSKEWPKVHKCRAVIQRSAITRERPWWPEGWEAQIDLQCIMPEYVSPTVFHDILVDAGRFVGVADYRPTYGRFQVIHSEILED